MKYERFTELMEKQFPGGLVVEGSPKTLQALCAAAEGDFSHFDEISKQLKKIDGNK